jgi:hypothetical protein
MKLRAESSRVGACYYALGCVVVLISEHRNHQEQGLFKDTHVSGAVTGVSSKSLFQLNNGSQVLLVSLKGKIHSPPCIRLRQCEN